MCVFQACWTLTNERFSTNGNKKTNVNLIIVFFFWIHSHIFYLGEGIFAYVIFCNNTMFTFSYHRFLLQTVFNLRVLKYIYPRFITILIVNNIQHFSVLMKILTKITSFYFSFQQKLILLYSTRLYLPNIFKGKRMLKQPQESLWNILFLKITILNLVDRKRSLSSRYLANQF